MDYHPDFLSPLTGKQNKQQQSSIWNQVKFPRWSRVLLTPRESAPEISKISQWFDLLCTKHKKAVFADCMSALGLLSNHLQIVLTQEEIKLMMTISVVPSCITHEQPLKSTPHTLKSEDLWIRNSTPFATTPFKGVLFFQ